MKEIKLQTTFNKASMEDLAGESIIENNINEENIEEEEDED